MIKEEISFNEEPPLIINLSLIWSPFGEKILGIKISSLTFTKRVIISTATHPFKSVTEIVYVVVATGATICDKHCGQPVFSSPVHNISETESTDRLIIA